MGNNSYQPQICFNCQQWQSIQVSQSRFHHQNPYTNQKIMEDRVPLSTPRSISDDYSIYEWRVKNHGRNNLVEVFQINIP